MIFVTIGTCEPFERLIRAVDAFDPGEQVVVQTGLSKTRPELAESIDFLPYPRLVELVREARVVVTHAGVGTILTALLNGVRPVVVPRLEEHGEAVDDHQLELANRLERLGLITVVLDTAELGAAVRAESGRAEPVRPGEALVEELRSFIAGAAA
jgi:UDP-N-acetylglucosamine transferase subunit ALG13